MERNDIEYDPETGLPQLREGLFWRIGDTSSGYLAISIEHEVSYHKEFMGVKYGKRTDLKTYEGLYAHIRTSAMSDDEIKDKAEELYTELDRLDATKARIESLVGIYPPKKL